jgi:hypothetical protein
MTPAMWATPRELMWCRALHGYWQRFPVSPVSAHARFADQVARARRRGRGGYGIAQALQPLLDDQDRRLAGDPAARLALWRGLLTAGIEALGEVRDRDGELAGFLGGSLAAYARLPWQPGIEAEVYFVDLCELCVWENHGLLYQRETAPFAGVGVEHHELVERLLWSLAAELTGHRLGYQAEVAMGLVAHLQAATARLDRLVATAERLGSDQWMPIVTLAETALAAGRRDLARRSSPPPTGPAATRTTWRHAAWSSPASRRPATGSASSSSPRRPGIHARPVSVGTTSSSDTSCSAPSRRHRATSPRSAPAGQSTPTMVTGTPTTDASTGRSRASSR